jgi:hypothetical protein
MLNNCVDSYAVKGEFLFRQSKEKGLTALQKESGK